MSQIMARTNRERKFQGANVPGSEYSECESSRERKLLGHFAPGSESHRERIGQGPISWFAPGSELAQEWKGYECCTLTVHITVVVQAARSRNSTRTCMCVSIGKSSRTINIEPTVIKCLGTDLRLQDLLVSDQYWVKNVGCNLNYRGWKATTFQYPISLICGAWLTTSQWLQPDTRAFFVQKVIKCHCRCKG